MALRLGVIAIAAALAVVPFGAATAGPLDDGDIAYRCRDYSTAIGLWSPLAEQGNAEAQVKVGRMYDFGFGVTQSYAVAANWYRKAAEQGNADAEFSLGFLYDFGHGVPQDYGVAADWYRKAAEQGDPQAESKLGSFYFSGQGIAQDYTQAVMWLRKAADLRDPTAHLLLVMMYSGVSAYLKILLKRTSGSVAWRASERHQRRRVTKPVRGRAKICFATAP